ncbi:DUF2264 domain-containing protein [Aeromonas sp. QDB62]|uniref:DUF2264 domain-containing protein n=1 Tax=Aeromonas sp. QDB62 TaxID=2990499 RepID=UPI0022E18AA4|nr:DUF2264 domain-containing protein [Aeromonas sp. QDB62]
MSDIKITKRPIVPYENPNWNMYLHLFQENLVRLFHKKRSYTRNDNYISTIFSTPHTELKFQCDELVKYVAEAFEYYAVWDYTHAYYPGRPSQQNARTDAMEGASRLLPTLAAWLYSKAPNESNLVLADGRQLSPADIIYTAFLAGTDSNHPGFWGVMHDCDQRICESADLALTLWLSREHVWIRFDNDERAKIVAWFSQVNTLVTVDNNWHLFPLTVQFVLKSLTGVDHVDHDKYERIKEFHVGAGWFRDGALGNYDYYNAWGFHYSLYWLDQILPDFDPEFIRGTLAEFVASYRYLFTTQGLPFFGRSACYRLAAAAPLIAAADHGILPSGEVKHAFSSSLSYFISNGALEAGLPTQGVFGGDDRLIDNYSGPASSLWSLRALNVALYCGERSGLWEAQALPLPVEQGDFTLAVPAIGLQIQGVRETNEVVALFRFDYTAQQSPLTRRLEQQHCWSRCKEWVIGRAERPKNNLLRKGVTCYTSKMFHFF